MRDRAVSEVLARVSDSKSPSYLQQFLAGRIGAIKISRRRDYGMKIWQSNRD
jgi:hypothetical protein